MRGEKWLAVPGWPGYEVSGRGRARSVDRLLSDGREAGGKLLKPSRDKDRYKHVTLSDGRRRQDFHVARLVLEAFSGPCPPGMEACHRNGRRWDNRAANLYWGTKPQNRADRERHRRERSAASTAAEPVTEVTGEDGGEARGTNETGMAGPCLLKVDSPLEGSRR